MKVAVSKTVDAKSVRGFESHPLRHPRVLGEKTMGKTCDRCGEILIREEEEDGNLCFECFEARIIETTPEENVMEKIDGGSE